MQIGGLGLFEKTNSKGAIVLASYHSPHSLTWSWSLWLSIDRKWRWPFLHAHKNNYGWQVSAGLPFVTLSRHRQAEMWYRDLWRTAREREDALEAALGRARRQVALAATPPAGGVQ